METSTEAGVRITVKDGDYPFVKVVVPWSEVYLVPFADMHIGGGFHEEVALEVRRFVMENENAFVVMGGDIIQNGNKRVGDMVFRLDMIPKEQKTYAGEFFRPIKDRIIGSVSGNHENWSFRDTGDDMMENIMTLIGGEEWGKQFYVGPEWFGAICSPTGKVCYTLYYSHGVLFHKNSGLAVNAVRRDSGDWLGSFDVRMRGHSHDCAFDFENTFHPNVEDGVVELAENYVVFTGHYQGRPDGYVSQGGMRPKPMGAMVVRLDMRRKGKNSVTGVRVG